MPFAIICKEAPPKGCFTPPGFSCCAAPLDCRERWVFLRVVGKPRILSDSSESPKIISLKATKVRLFCGWRGLLTLGRPVVRLTGRPAHPRREPLPLKRPPSRSLFDNADFAPMAPYDLLKLQGRQLSKMSSWTSSSPSAKTRAATKATLQLSAYAIAAFILRGGHSVRGQAFDDSFRCVPEARRRLPERWG